MGFDLNQCSVIVAEVLLFVSSISGYQFDNKQCDSPLLNGAALSATSQMENREASKARLNGGSAWTARNSDFDQQLHIDLGEVMQVTSIVTQGRQYSSEFVMEYTISYGYNGLDFTYYHDTNGNAKMFKGNKDSNSITVNVFDPPIIAQWVRINPTRWRDRISMRVELYGCRYVADTMNFNGSSLVVRKLGRYPVVSSQDTIRFRFKTSESDGVLLYSRGAQGDYIALEMMRNKLYLNIDLGAQLKTSLSVGSLLDDDHWHDVLIERWGKVVEFSVDRVVVREQVKGDYSQLNLDREILIGGVRYKEKGLTMWKNFTGCIENFFINKTNVIQAVKTRERDYEAYSTLFYCQETQIIPVTFLTSGSHLKLKGYEGILTLNVSLDFRTYEQNGLLIYHRMMNVGHLKLFLKEGRIMVEVVGPDMPMVVVDNFQEVFADGEWHSVMLTMKENLLTLSVDQRPMPTVRRMQVQTGPYYWIAGGLKDEKGFIGCMRYISVDGNLQHPLNWGNQDMREKQSILLDACQMMDRCTPNPCENNGRCEQTWESFSCNCDSTGYTGAVCHIPAHPHSCQAWLQSHQGAKRASITIDVDGSGPLHPFPVTCIFDDTETRTLVHHNLKPGTLVSGFSQPGSFIQEINYEADMEQIGHLVNRSVSCQQRIRFECKGAKLFNTPVHQGAETFRPSSWWVSRENQIMDYWGDSLPGSHKCSCGLYSSCTDPSKWCNCDAAGQDEWNMDAGYLKYKEHLPVRQLRVGDTDLKGKEVKLTLGPLECTGDTLFDNVITFRIKDANLEFPTFEMGLSGDIYFEFKTTQENAVFIHSQGPSDFIKVSIIGGDHIQFEYSAGGGSLGVNVETAKKLNDDEWHSVHVERNRLQARVVVDGAYTEEVHESRGPVRAMHLTSKLSVGSALDWRDGYVGCMRALMVNGKVMDLRSPAERGTYGVGVGCVGKCPSDPCLNNGTCHEGYDHYICDCRWTAFKGPICADEIGVNMRKQFMVKFTFDGSYKSTIAEDIRVGFTTTDPQGFLVGLYSPDTLEYLTLMVSNSGHLRLVFDFGFERQEFIYRDHIFNAGQFHDVRLRREESGSKLILQVDNYPPMIEHLKIGRSADAQFNNIKYFYIGKNETMQDGFVGCISRVQFDDIFPLKLLFQQDPPKNINGTPETIHEDFCAIEPVTHPPEMVETRPPPSVDPSTVQEYLHTGDSAILGGVLALIFVALVIMLVLIGRSLSRHKGAYLTQEDSGAQGADDADEAVIHSHTGSRVQRKKEWFI